MVTWSNTSRLTVFQGNKGNTSAPIINNANICLHVLLLYYPGVFYWFGHTVCRLRNVMRQKITSAADLNVLNDQVVTSMHCSP